MNAEDERFARYDDYPDHLWGISHSVSLPERRFVNALCLLDAALKSWWDIGLMNVLMSASDPDVCLSRYPMYPDSDAAFLPDDREPPSDDLGLIRHLQDGAVSVLMVEVEQAVTDYREFKRLCVDALDLALYVPTLKCRYDIQVALCRLKSIHLDDTDVCALRSLPDAISLIRGKNSPTCRKKNDKIPLKDLRCLE